MRSLVDKSTAMGPSCRSPLSRTCPRSTSRPESVLGNQLAQRVGAAGVVQAKLAVSQPLDPAELEADRVADQVMRMPAPGAVQAKAGCPDCSDDAPCSRCATRHAAVHRRAVPGEHPGSQSLAADDAVRSLGAGRSLDPDTRAFFESRFGYDFRDVRVHTDARADRSARMLGALAYTAGPNLAFRHGSYAPNAPEGRRLLAHELTHTIQQGAVRSTGARPIVPGHAGAGVQRQAAPPVPDPNGGLETEMLRQLARQLRRAMAGLGTDEDAIFAAMAGRTQPQVDAIARVYAEMYARVLAADLQDELNDSEMRQLAVFSPTAAPADAAQPGAALADAVAWRLDKAMKGIGTDENAIYAALTGRTVDERREIKAAYLRRTRRELEADLRDELSGSELTQALMLLNQGLLQPEDELYLAMEGLGTDEDTIFRVLSSLSGDPAALTTLEANYRSKYGDLVQDLRDDLSADEYKRARSYITPTILDADVEDCGGGGTPAQTTESVRRAHARAVWMLNTAIARSANVADPAVQAAALRYFKITLPATTSADAIHWAFVRRALNSMTAAEVNATYECEPKQSLFHGFCGSDSVGVTIFNIHLCPNWWTTYSSLDQRAGVLIHEWGHKFGTGVALIFETYCFGGAYASASAGQLVTWPDAYMQFAWDLSIGAPAPCF